MEQLTANQELNLLDLRKYIQEIVDGTVKDTEETYFPIRMYAQVIGDIFESLMQLYNKSRWITMKDALKREDVINTLLFPSVPRCLDEIQLMFKEGIFCDDQLIDFIAGNNKGFMFLKGKLDNSPLERLIKIRYEESSEDYEAAIETIMGTCDLVRNENNFRVSKYDYCIHTISYEDIIEFLSVSTNIELMIRHKEYIIKTIAHISSLINKKNRLNEQESSLDFTGTYNMNDRQDIQCEDDDDEIDEEEIEEWKSSIISSAQMSNRYQTLNRFYRMFINIVTFNRSDTIMRTYLLTDCGKLFVVESEDDARPLYNRYCIRRSIEVFDKESSEQFLDLLSRGYKAEYI